MAIARRRFRRWYAGDLTMANEIFIKDPRMNDAMAAWQQPASRRVFMPPEGRR